MNKLKKYGSNAVTYAILTVVMLITVFPIIYTVAAAFKSNTEILVNPSRVFPEEPTLDNFITAFSSKDFNVPRMTLNSLIYTLLNVLFTVLTSSAGGYVFARGEFPCKKIIFTAFSALMFISLGSVTMYPLFNLLNIINLNGSLWGLLVIKFFGVHIVNIYLIRSYVNSITYEIDEAAKIDGCSFIGIFFRIIAPLLKPILATIGILAFQGSWNEYLMPTIFTMNNPEQQTLIVGITALKNSGSAASSWNLMLAGSVVALLPVLIAYAVGNKFIIAGLTSGAVKG